jgi:hypothetical protein
MTFRLWQAKYNQENGQAYVELRAAGESGGVVIAIAMFSFRTTAHPSKHRIEQDVVRRARQLLQMAAANDHEQSSEPVAV